MKWPRRPDDYVRDILLYAQKALEFTDKMEGEDELRQDERTLLAVVRAPDFLVFPRCI